MEVAIIKTQAFIPYSTQLIRDLGPLPGDEEEYAKRVKPYRGGILSARRLRDKRIKRERLIKDSKALRHALRWASEDLVDAKGWGDHLAAKVPQLERVRIAAITVVDMLDAPECVVCRRFGAHAEHCEWNALLVALGNLDA